MDKTIYTFDGSCSYKIEADEINGIDGNPSGHYQMTSISKQSVYGAYLDSENNKNNLHTAIKNLHRNNLNCCIVSNNMEHYFILSRVSGFVDWQNIFKPLGIANLDPWYEWLLCIIEQNGYLNNPYIEEENKIIFPLVSKKDPSKTITLTMFPIDEGSYIRGQESDNE